MSVTLENWPLFSTELLQSEAKTQIDWDLLCMSVLGWGGVD